MPVVTAGAAAAAHAAADSAGVEPGMRAAVPVAVPAAARISAAAVAAAPAGAGAAEGDTAAVAAPFVAGTTDVAGLPEPDRVNTEHAGGEDWTNQAAVVAVAMEAAVVGRRCCVSRRLNADRARPQQL